MCVSCNDTGTIWRRTTRHTQSIVRQSWWCEGELIEAREDVVFEMGGIDACPVCAAKAEAEYQANRGDE